MAPLGVHIDPSRNAELVGVEGAFSTPESPIGAWVIPSDEERIIAKETFELLCALGRAATRLAAGGGIEMATTSRTSGEPTSAEEFALMDAWWRAANYLSVGQIYLLDNPLLREPLRLEHIKPRLLGHWGTTPGLNFIYVHINRLIRHRDLNAMYIIGPGHGAPGMLANTYLEGTYSEVYPHIRRDAEGMRRFFRQFSFPGGIPSHVAAETPGSIHEGGELGYSLVHAYGAAFDNPDLTVFCIVGDGEAETGPLATSWHSNKFLNAGARRCRRPDPAPERLQDRESHGARAHPAGRTAQPLRGLRL